MYLDKALKEIIQEEWKELLLKKDYCQIARTLVDYDKNQSFEICTIWTGFDFTGKNKVFGTRVFVSKHTTDLTKWSIKYKTLKEALAGHEKVCEAARKGKYSKDVLEAQEEEQTQEEGA